MGRWQGFRRQTCKKLGRQLRKGIVPVPAATGQGLGRFGLATKSERILAFKIRDGSRGLFHSGILTAAARAPASRRQFTQVAPAVQNRNPLTGCNLKRNNCPAIEGLTIRIAAPYG